MTFQISGQKFWHSPSIAADPEHPVDSPNRKRCRVYSFRSSNQPKNQPMPDDITEKVLDLIASTKRIPREQVSVSSTFAELGLDSLDAINLIFEIESTFNISVPDAVANSVSSVPQVVEELRKLLTPTSQQLPPE
jgi:acyl carrier protein